MSRFWPKKIRRDQMPKAPRRKAKKACVEVRSFAAKCPYCGRGLKGESGKGLLRPSDIDRKDRLYCEECHTYLDMPKGFLQIIEKETVRWTR